MEALGNRPTGPLGMPPHQQDHHEERRMIEPGMAATAEASDTARERATPPAAAPDAATAARALPPLPKGRLVLLALAGVSLILGLDGALVRLGGLAPIPSAPLGDVHGPLMVYGFLGTAICLERAVALQSGDRPVRWAYAAPLASGFGALSAIALALVPGFAASLPFGARVVPGALWTLATALLNAIYLEVHRHRQASHAVLVQLVGAVIGLGGALLWLRGLETPRIVAWFLLFLVVTIVGERLELARLAFLSGATEPRILAESLAVLVALAASLLSPAAGFPLLGGALGALVADTAIHDVARRTIRLPGLPRLAAMCMLAAYAWATVPVIAWIAAPPAFSGFLYDAEVHALALGFVVSMLLAHAPVIVPAVAKRPVPYHPTMHLGLVLLQGSLVVRLLAGARAADVPWRFGGALGVVAMLVFAGTTLALAILASCSPIDEGGAGNREGR